MASEYLLRYSKVSDPEWLYILFYLTLVVTLLKTATVLPIF